MCHGRGAISSLFLLVILHAERASQVFQRLQLLEQAATEQLNARRNAEHALVEAQTRITQLDQALQQGGRPAAAAGQVVDTRVLGMPDKWDGGKKSWRNWSFVMKAYAGAISQELSTDMTNAESSTDVLSKETMAGQRMARSVQLYFVPDHGMHGKSFGSHRKSTVRLGHGGVTTSLSGVFSEEQCKTCCDDARILGVSDRHERCGEQSGDGGTEDQRVREVREHRLSGIPEDWHRDSSSGGRTDEDASHHELAQVGNIPAATFQNIKTSKPRVR